MINIKHILVPVAGIVLFQLIWFFQTKFSEDYRAVTSFTEKVVKGERKENGKLPDDDSVIYSDVIDTKSGPVRGKLVIDRELGFQYYAYQGIPYGESPEGSLRFKPPIPKRPWKEIFNATEYSKSCYQPEYVIPKTDMSEDCLTLDIFVPNLKNVSGLPVLVIVIGGGFQFEAIGQKPLHNGVHVLFVKFDIIVVIIRFRQGALAFFTLGTEDATGNNLQKDLLLGLKWINENIDNFGGDKNKITLEGISSAAVIIEFLILSEKSKGLFQQAILDSGSMLSFKMFGRYPVQASLDLAKDLGIKDRETKMILERMKKAHPFTIVQAEQNIATKNAVKRPNRFFPHAEIKSEHAVLTTNPKDIIEKSSFVDIKVLMGLMEEENFCCLTLATKDGLKKLNDNIEYLIPDDIEYPLSSESSKKLAKLIHDFYFNGSDINFKSLKNLMLMAGDNQHTYAISTLLKYFEKILSKIYFYVGHFVSEVNVFSVINGYNVSAMAHCGAAFQHLNSKLLRNKYLSNDVSVINMSTKILTLNSNFIKYGDPTPHEYNGIKWPEYITEKKFLEIGEELKVKSEFSASMKRRIEFWKKNYEEYEEYVRQGGVIEPKFK